MPPGHYLLASGGEVRLARYWDFDYPAADEARPMRPDAAYAEEFGRALDEAVRLRLRADVPVACYLSGGLDSCAVLGLAARHHAGPIRAFTLTFDRPDYDEGAIAREMAEHAGADFCPVPVAQDDLADHFADAVAQAEALLLNAHGVAKYLLSRAVRAAGYKVVLTGEGADEVLAGYPHFRRDLLLHGAGDRDEAAVRPLLEALRTSNPASRGLLLPDGEAASLAGVREALGFAPTWLEANATIARKLRDLYAADFAAEVAGRDAGRELLAGLDVPGQLAGRDPVAQSQYLWSKVVLPNYVLTVLGDRMEMAHSVEGRVPFLDHPFVELARGLPADAEDPGGDGEVRAARGGPPGADGHRLRPAQAPVPDAPGDARPRRAAERAGAGDAARPGPGGAAVLRPREGRGAAGRAARDGRGRPHRVRPGPDGRARAPAPCTSGMASSGARRPSGGDPTQEQLLRGRVGRGPSLARAG